jgi:glutamine synthetase
MIEQQIRWIKADYLWLDGALPTQRLRSKIKVIGHNGLVSLSTFEEWGFDGSSTYQALGNDSDLMLKPVSFYPDPVRGKDYYLVMCEVFAFDGKPHISNTRAALRKILDVEGKNHEPWAGFEQEYTFFRGNRPLGWPEIGYPAPQGPFYCSIGADVAFGRNIVEEHFNRCLSSKIMIYGINSEVMPGQWEFQIGYRGITNEDASILKMADETWIARYLLCMVAEKYGVQVSFDVKPVKGDWNGAGMHTNFSTKKMRDPNGGMAAIEEAIRRLSQRHNEHIAMYGANNHERLTGLHETCSIQEFRSGVANRGCSVRVPRLVAEQGYGYFEDRRPGANADPYAVAYMLVATVLGVNATNKNYLDVVNSSVSS